MRYLFLILALFTWQAASAVESAPVIYTLTTVKIISKPGAVSNAANADKKKEGDAKSDITRKPPESSMPTPATVPHEFSVEVRPLSFLVQKDFISHQPFTDKNGMLFLIQPPQTARLSATRIVGKADVLLVTQDGVISKIAPELMLSSLEEPIDSQTPIHAFIFLQAGITKADNIQPGDRVESPMFKTHPVILEESSPPTPQEQPKAQDAPKAENKTEDNKTEEKQKP
jgi:uncharacterized membrane protein (UPF0127 family)